MYRPVSEHTGLVLMAATNLLEGLDPALIREGRFDVRIRVDLPDESTRRRIFEAQLTQKPWTRCNLDGFAQRTPGASAAKIKSIVDRAAAIAAQENRRSKNAICTKRSMKPVEGTVHCFNRYSGRT
jgi:ATP-dependent Zn protease